MSSGAKWWLEFLFTSVVFLLGLIGNIFVLIIVLQRETRKTTNVIFVTCLACADLVLVCSNSLISILGQFKIIIPCSSQVFSMTLVTTGYNAGLFTITSMAIHRYFVITHPWEPKLKRRKALIWVSLVWLIAFTLTIPIMIVLKPTQNGNCREVWPSRSLSQAYTTTLMSVQFFIPLIITATCYIKIWLFLRRRPVIAQRRLRTGESTTREETARESVVILRTVAVIVVLFFVLLLPLQVAWMLLDFKHISFDELWIVSALLIKLHSCVNPIVYGIMNKQYRQSYIKLLSPMLGLCCHHPSTGSTTRQAPLQPRFQGRFTSLPLELNPGNENGIMATSREKHGD
ncbi:PREDICTED: neuropeptide Y receptor type 6-like [Acropora digitifera]|uniref:neuropeptide Y receptor type 6-like n=1 Tax=Acropora digitifera TaxID=70779 RepID=UPI00077A4840|nr:PREDICTED: neuropeptide Y receptor type 6-like [Acropora digitifera]